MTWSQRNLADTVPAKARDLRRSRCKVGHAIDPCGNGGRTWAMHHTWKRREGLASSRCLNCSLTLKQILRPRDEVYPPPPPEEGSEAHLARALRTGA